MQEDNAPKHTRRSTERKKMVEEKVNVLKWPSQSLDLNLTEMLWNGLKQIVHVRKSTKIPT